MVLNSTSTGAICFRTSNKSFFFFFTLLWEARECAPAMFRDDCVTAFASQGRSHPACWRGKCRNGGGRSRPSSRRFVQRRCRRERMLCGKGEITLKSGQLLRRGEGPPSCALYAGRRSQAG